MNFTGNIISGQVMGETAKYFSERFGKINQMKESIPINRTDTSFSKSTNLDFAIPQSRISGLSSGEFVGMVADDPLQKIKLKTYHYEIINHHDLQKTESNAYRGIPQITEVSPQMVGDNFKMIKKEVAEIVDGVIERTLNTPGLGRIRN